LDKIKTYFQEETDKLRMHYQEETLNRLQQIEQLALELKEHEKIFSRYEEREKFASQIYGITEAHRLLSEAVKQGKPFAQEFNNLIKRSEGQEVLVASCAVLPQNIPQLGVVTSDQLRTDFKRLIPEARRFETVHDTKEKSWGQVLTNVVKPQAGHTENALIQGDIFARADFYLERGNIESVLRELQQVKSASTQSMLEPWIAQAKNYLVAQQFLEATEAQISVMRKSAAWQEFQHK